MKKVITILLLLVACYLTAQDLKYLNRVGTLKLEYADQVYGDDNRLIVTGNQTIYHYDTYSRSKPYFVESYISDKAFSDILLIKDKLLIASEELNLHFANADTLTIKQGKLDFKQIVGSNFSREGSILHTSHTDTGLFVEDIRRGDISQFHDYFGLLDVSAQWPFVYAINTSGLVVIDVGDIYIPKAGAYNYNIFHPRCLDVEDSKAVVGTKNQVVFVDVSTPTDPIVMKTIRLAHEVESVHIVDNEAFVVLGKGGLKIYDISNLKKPREINSYDTRGQALDIFIEANYIYIADGTGGVVILKYAVE
ncbi:MAG: hypothetical protein P9L91_04170 [Candidatus Zophobacter franzmannii]|jgi:hypothetical protein|nr:hypothetical protein [Candidatus Zophobacter franzmannii]